MLLACRHVFSKYVMYEVWSEAPGVDWYISYLWKNKYCKKMWICAWMFNYESRWNGTYMSERCQIVQLSLLFKTVFRILIVSPITDATFIVIENWCVALCLCWEVVVYTHQCLVEDWMCVFIVRWMVLSRVREVVSLR